jgi:hypothetical protein
MVKRAIIGAASGQIVAGSARHQKLMIGGN